MSIDGVLEFVQEELQPLGPVVARRMFGGAGLFLDGLMFALLADDALYLKADHVNQPAFEAEGLSAFTYARGGKRIALSYWQAPERLLDDAEELRAWAAHAIAAARRGRPARKPSAPARRARAADEATPRRSRRGA